MLLGPIRVYVNSKYAFLYEVSNSRAQVEEILTSHVGCCKTASQQQQYKIQKLGQQ
jgi:hypothetical protein